MEGKREPLYLLTFDSARYSVIDRASNSPIDFKYLVGEPRGLALGWESFPYTFNRVGEIISRFITYPIQL